MTELSNMSKSVTFSLNLKRKVLFKAFANFVALICGDIVHCGEISG